ncbi:MAG: peptidylprolyl isomerase [Chlamydiota bacterium]
MRFAFVIPGCRRRPTACALRAAPAILLLCAAPRPPAQAEIKEQIVAVVNDEIITYSEIEKILSPVFEQYEQIYSGAELFTMLQKARRDVLNHLVEERLIIQDAKRQKIREQMGDDFAKEVEQSIAEVKAKFPSEEEFQKSLKRQGFTMDGYRAQEEQRTLVRAMLIKEVSARCGVSPAEIKAFYEAHPKEFTEGEKIHVSQIWIKDTPEKPGEAERMAREVLSRLDAGESFAELARKYSNCPYAQKGGDWGFIGRGHWNRELEDAAFALEPGAHSGIVKSTLGYHLIMLHEKKPATVKSLAGVYKAIEDKLFREKAGVKRDEWLARLRKKAYISMVK